MNFIHNIHASTLGFHTFIRNILFLLFILAVPNPSQYQAFPGSKLRLVRMICRDNNCNPTKLYCSVFATAYNFVVLKIFPGV